MLNQMRKLIQEDPFQMIIKEESIYIANYKKLITLEEKRISLLTKEKKIIVTGNNLKAKKLLEKEILITGVVENIEVIHER